MMDIKVILKKLSEKRSVFHMEADFQLALFREIAEVLGTSKDIYLEHLEGGICGQQKQQECQRPPRSPGGGHSPYLLQSNHRHSPILTLFHLG